MELLHSERLAVGHLSDKGPFPQTFFHFCHHGKLCSDEAQQKVNGSEASEVPVSVSYLCVGSAKLAHPLPIFASPNPDPLRKIFSHAQHGQHPRVCHIVLPLSFI